MTTKLFKKGTFLSALFAAVLTLGMTTQATAEIRQVDGNVWEASSTNEKQAYLMGVANTVAVNRALQMKRGQLDPNSANTRIFAAMDQATIDTAISKIDNWYAGDSSRLNTPVLGVVWLGLVKAMQ